MQAPVGFGVVLRMRVLERDAGCALGRIRHEREVVGVARACHAAVAVAPARGVEVEVVAAGALVGVGHRAALRQAPGAGYGNRTVDATRAGRGGHHHAALRRVERVRHLHQHAVRMRCAGHPRIGRELAAGHAGHAAVQAAVAACGGQVGDAAPAAPDRAAAQFPGGRAAASANAGGTIRRRLSRRARRSGGRRHRDAWCGAVLEHGRFRGGGAPALEAQPARSRQARANPRFCDEARSTRREQ